MDYQEFLGKADVWDAFEAVDMLLGLKPITRDDPNQNRAHDLRELAYRAIDAGILPCIGKKKERRVSPADFCRWVTSKGYEIPAAWQEAHLARPEENCPTPVPQPSVAETPSPEVKAEPPSPATTKRKVAWQAEMVERWGDITGDYPRPSALQTMDWLKKKGATDVFPRDQKNRFSLQWMDAYGNTKSVTIKTVGNVLSQLRKEKKIPA